MRLRAVTTSGGWLGPVLLAVLITMCSIRTSATRADTLTFTADANQTDVRNRRSHSCSCTTYYVVTSLTPFRGSLGDAWFNHLQALSTPSFYSISGMAAGSTSISDGGGDMYDGGNMLRTSLFNNDMRYTNNFQTDPFNRNAFGTNSNPTMRFGRTMVLWVPRVTATSNINFYVRGNLGADGSGRRYAQTYRSGDFVGYRKSVEQACDPTVNHMIVYRYSSAARQTVDSSTGSDGHTVYGIPPGSPFMYILYSSPTSSCIHSNLHQAIFNHALTVISSCVAPGVPNSNREAAVNITNGSRRNYTCDSDFRPSTHTGPGGSGGTFFGPVCTGSSPPTNLSSGGSCIRVTCGPTDNPANVRGRVLNETEMFVNENYTITCDEGFGVDGNYSVRTYMGTCSASGRYEADVSCEPLMCYHEDLDDINIEVMNGTTAAGQVANVPCAQDYGVGGSGSIRSFTRECIDRGLDDAPSFGQTNATCERVTCGSTPADPNAVASAQTALSSEVIEYTCNQQFVYPTAELGGFNSNRTSTVTCLTTGNYTALSLCTPQCTQHLQYTNSLGRCFNCRPTCNYAIGEYQQVPCSGMEDRVCANCTRGTYRASRFSSSCTTCNQICANGQTVEGRCDQDRIIGNPLRCVACPVGQYSTNVSATMGRNFCTACGRGFVCSLPTSDATSRTPCDGLDSFAPETNGSQCQTVDLGHYSVSAGGVPNQVAPHVDQRPCENGYSCPNGARIACNASDGQYQDTMNSTSCKTADTGHYIAPVGGVIGIGQQICEAGYECTNVTRRACGVNTFSALNGSTHCLPATRSSTQTYVVILSGGLRIGRELCEAGTYCSTVGPSGDFIKEPCPAGFECPDGANRTACVDGMTFSDTPNATNCRACRVCPISHITTAACVTTRNTVCDDRIPPVFEDATDTIQLEAAIDTFGSVDDPVRAFDDQSPDLPQDLSCRIVRASSNTAFMAPPGTCNPLTACRCLLDGFVNTSVLGTHTVIYTVEDDAVPPNRATSTRQVVVRDNTPPIIQLNQPDNVDVAVSEDSFDPVLEASYISLIGVSDAYESSVGIDLRDRLQIHGKLDLLAALGVTETGVVVDYRTMARTIRLRPEGFTLEYSVADNAGNRAASVFQTFHVIDETAPVVTPTQPRFNIQATRESLQLNATAQAVDFVDGIIDPNTIYVDLGGFESNKTGVYTVRFSASDSSGNVGDATVVVTVADTEQPIILLDGTRVSADFGSFWNASKGVSVSDSFDREESLTVSWSVSLLNTGDSDYTFVESDGAGVDTSAPLGTTFEVEYVASDTSANTATATQTVAIEDISPPRFTFDTSDGAVQNAVVVSGQYVLDDCPTVTDNVEEFPTSDCHDRILNASFRSEIPGIVYRYGFSELNNTRFGTVGNFTVTYRAVDEAGNVGEAVRVFMVQSSPAASTSGSEGSTAIIIGAVVAVVIVLLIVVAITVVRRRNDKKKQGADFAAPALYENSNFSANARNVSTIQNPGYKPVIPDEEGISYDMYDTVDPWKSCDDNYDADGGDEVYDAIDECTA